MTVRAALRTMDGLIVAANASHVRAPALSRLRRQIGVEDRGVALVVCDVPEALHASESRRVGDPRLLWRRERARPRGKGPGPRPVEAGAPEGAAPRGEAPRKPLRLVHK
jgi:hypothetical protein